MEPPPYNNRNPKSCKNTGLWKVLRAIIPDRIIAYLGGIGEGRLDAQNEGQGGSGILPVQLFNRVVRIGHLQC
jgi:hypothetical protein